MTTWADKRKHLIEAILIIVGAAIIAVVLISVLYKAPSCLDGKQNQGELGVDCGGPCPYACTFSESAPSVRFIRTVSPQPGRTDVIAYIDNSNSDAELVKAPYEIDLYGPNKTIVAHSTGYLTIPPSTTYPLYLADYYQSGGTISQAFLTFKTTKFIWLRTAVKPVVPVPSNILIQDGAAPKITASLGNETGQTLYGLTIIGTVFDSSNNAIAASQTLVAQIPSQSTAPIIFTWNEPFPKDAARVEFLPVPSS